MIIENWPIIRRIINITRFIFSTTLAVFRQLGNIPCCIHRLIKYDNILLIEEMI